MASSPFSTIEEFTGAIDGPTEGAIYTFAKTPMINNIALVAAVGLFVWFIFSAYSDKKAGSTKVDKSLNRLSTFIVVGLLSLVAADHRYASRSTADVERSAQGVSAPMFSNQASRQMPLGLLGMLGVGLPTFRQVSGKFSGKVSGKRKKRSPRGYRSPL